MAYLAERIIPSLKESRISAELIDLRTVKPLDTDTILRSVRKTGKAIILDVGWKSFGISAEIAAIISESGIELKLPIKRIALPDVPAPAARTLEAEYYFDEEKLINRIKEMLK
jgi:pyruvate dehydrogenase E1 component beta subunit